MLRQNEENHSDKHDEVEQSRRSFFGRLAMGAVLSMAMPGVVHAAKKSLVKADKSHRSAQPARSAVRLPKPGGVHAAKAAIRGGKAGSGRASGKHQKTLAGKSAHTEHGRSQIAHADPHARHNVRVRDVYNGKKHGANIEHHYASRHHHGKGPSMISADRREPMLEPVREPMFLADRGRLVSHRALAFQNPHTGDKLTLTYFEKGRYLSDALNEISFLLRDYRTGDVHPIDPELLDQLHDLKQMLGLSQPFDVICGYRSPLTNAKLHAEHTGVANNSFHIYGRAVDIRIERFDLRRIHNAALAMHRGGVGYYPESNFIHLDTGTFRTWSL